MPFTASSLRNYLAGGGNLIIYLNVCPLSLKEMKVFLFVCLFLSNEQFRELFGGGSGFEV